MTKYNCTHCNFHTNRKTDYSRHVESTKHKQKVQETNDAVNDSQQVVDQEETAQFQCMHCKNLYSLQSSLSKHMKTCSQKVIDEIIQEKDIATMKNNQEQKDLFISHLLKENERLNKQVDTYAELLRTAYTPPTVNNFTYINTTYPKPRAIGQLESYKPIHEAKTMSLISVLQMYHEQGTLCQFIGNFLVNAYAKKDANDQSIWSTDISRLTYIISELQESGKIKWVIDKKGIKTKKYVINPLLQYLRDEMSKYILKYSNSTEDSVISKLKAITEMFVLIDKDILANEVIRYMAPYFAVTTIKDSEPKIKQIEASHKINNNI